MSKPNLFDYATSELSQDAMLGYMLAWADPKYSENTALHRLGQDVLLALLDKAERNIEEIRREIKKVIVKKQDHRIDISVDINEKIFMIIEDKIKTGPHGNQIERYKDEAAARFKDKGENRDIVAIYFKTGNESKWFHPKLKLASCFFRKDLLDVLSRNPNTGNDIVEEFRTHLQRWENDTQSFRETKPSGWSWMAVQGFFMDLEKRLDEEGQMRKDKGWHYVHNKKGGFLGFWWHPEQNGGKSKNGLTCTLLHIEAKPTPGLCVLKLYVRVEINTKGEKITRELLDELREKVTSVVADWPDITVKRCGRAGGKSSNVAQICFFKETDGGFPAKNADGMLDFDETMRRFGRAIELLNRIPPQK